MTKTFTNPTHLILLATVLLLALGGAALMTDSVAAAPPGGGGDQMGEGDGDTVGDDPSDDSTPGLGNPCFRHEWHEEAWVQSCLSCTRLDGGRGVEDWLLRCYWDGRDGYYWGYAPGEYAFCSSRSC